MDVAEKQGGKSFLLIVQMQLLNFIVQIVLRTEDKHRRRYAQACAQNNSAPQKNCFPIRLRLWMPKHGKAFLQKEKDVPQKIKQNRLARPDYKERLPGARPRLFSQKETSQCGNQQNAGDKASINIRGNFSDVPE